MVFSGGGFDELSGEEFLDHVELLEAARRDTEVQLLLAAGEWAVRNGPDTVDPVSARLPGRQVAKRYGGTGTPLVASFAPAEFGARIGRSTHAGEQMIADALDLAHRLPQLWARVRAGEVQVSYARFVARRTRDLDPDQAACVDSRVVESADGRITWSRFEALVEAAVKAADPDAARLREEEARAAQFARATRTSTDGVGGFYVRGDVATIGLLDSTVGLVAGILKQIGIDEPEDRRRVLAVAVLANPAHAVQLLASYAAWRSHPDQPLPLDEPAGAETDSETVMAAVLALVARSGWTPDETRAPTLAWGRLLPRVQLFVHLYGGELDESRIARIEGHGPVTRAWVRDTLGPFARFTIRPVFHPFDEAPVDSWEIPDRHRQAVRLMAPADCFPYATASLNQADGWPGMQLDHTLPWHPTDPDHDEPLSRVGNYGPLTAHHHNLKTHGGWQCRQPFPGIYLWRDRYGATYLVDNTGTRRIHTTRRTTPIHLDLITEDYTAA